MYNYDIISLTSYLNEKRFRKELQRTSKHTFHVQYLLHENRALYETMWKNMIQTDRQASDYDIVWRMRFACCIRKATDTHSESVILIAFSQQQWLQERVSMLRLCVYCLSCL
jgi:hypothetical protein